MYENTAQSRGDYQYFTEHLYDVSTTLLHNTFLNTMYVHIDRKSRYHQCSSESQELSSRHFRPSSVVCTFRAVTCSLCGVCDVLFRYIIDGRERETRTRPIGLKSTEQRELYYRDGSVYSVRQITNHTVRRQHCSCITMRAITITVWVSRDDKVGCRLGGECACLCLSA